MTTAEQSGPPSRPTRPLTPGRLATIGVALVALGLVVGVEKLRDQVPRNAESWVRIGVLVALWLLVFKVVLPRIVKHKPTLMALTLVSLLALGWYNFSPLFRNKTVIEALPDRTATAPSPAAAGPRKISSAPFKGIVHGAKGEVAIYQGADGRHLVRFENISIENGPDLYVYLVPEPGQENDDGGINLGRLKGNRGSQNYDIPPNVDITKFHTVLVWCRMFAVPFANATFTSPSPAA